MALNQTVLLGTIESQEDITITKEDKMFVSFTVPTEDRETQKINILLNEGISTYFRNHNLVGKTVAVKGVLVNHKEFGYIVDIDKLSFMGGI